MKELKRSNAVRTNTTGNDNLTPVLIVLRHAVDGSAQHHDPLEFNPNVAVTRNREQYPKDKNLGKKTSIDIFRNLLCSDIGDERAADLAPGLTRFIKDNNFAPVSEVISMFPPEDYDGGTPNPIMTITPYVQELQGDTVSLPNSELKLTLYDSHTYSTDKFDNEKLV